MAVLRTTTYGYYTYLINSLTFYAESFMLAGTSVAQTKPAFTEVDFSSIQSPNDNPFGKDNEDAKGHLLHYNTCPLTN